MKLSSSQPEELTPNAELAFDLHKRSIFVTTDRLFAGLLIFEWLAVIVTALISSPRTWSGGDQYNTPACLGLLWYSEELPLACLYYSLCYNREKTITRHTVAIGQMLMSSLLIHVSGGANRIAFSYFWLTCLSRFLPGLARADYSIRCNGT